ncbi:MAG: hypothetical protein P8X91_03180 [Candidatus Bathyarchaeota archaeon]
MNSNQKYYLAQKSEEELDTEQIPKLLVESSLQQNYLEQNQESNNPETKTDDIEWKSAYIC